MGLLQEIRMLSNPNAGIIKADAHNEYAPHWLSILAKRGVYRMCEKALKEEEKSCREKTGKTFYEWLKENKLSLKETSPNNYAIY